MAHIKWFGVALVVVIFRSSSASNLGSDFLDAGIYKRLLAAKRHHTFADWLDDSVVRRISVTGQQSIGLHLTSVTGDTTAYDNSTAFGQGNQTITDIGQANIDGRNVLGVLNFSASVADNRYQDPTNHKFHIDYERGPWKFHAGDISASLTGSNQFLSFSRQLRGVTVGYDSKWLSFRALDSEATSSVTTISFAGTNSPGPYYLQASQLVADTVRVEVDGRELNYPADYTVNAVVGSITFSVLSVPPTSTIVVSYESTGVNNQTGTVQGAGALMNFGKFGSIGVSAIRQLQPGGSGLSSYVQRFQGYGDPSTPYILDYVPLASQPLIVTLDGVQEVPNVDYQLNPANPTFLYFLRFVATTSTVTVTYTPTPSSSLQGDRQVEGFDYTLPFGKKGRNGSITYSEAISHLSSPVTPLNGTARGLSANYKFGRFHFNGNVDDIPNTFVGVQSTDFQRNERATTLTADYKLTKSLTASVAGSNSAISTETTDSNGNLVFQPARTTREDAALKYLGDSGITWNMDQQHLTSWGVSGEATADETTFTLSKLLGKLNNHFNLSRTEGYGPISDGITTTMGSVSLNSIGWNGDYAASRGITFGGHLTLSQVDTAGVNGLGTDTALSLNFRRPDLPYGFETSYTYSNSGQIATLGTFQNGFGSGYNGNGFSGGGSGNSLTAGSTGFNAGGTDVRRWESSASWNVAKRASLGANFVSSDESGALSTDSETTSYGLSLDYDLRNGQRLGLSLNQSYTTFSDASQNADSLSLNLFAGGRPKGPWSYRFGLGALVSSGGTIAQNSFTYNLSVKNYFRHNTQAIGFDIASSSLTNYEPQNDFQIGLSYEYQLFKSCSLLGKYQIHNVVNLDPTVTTGAFSSRGFDLELNFNFGS